ncbi:SAVED domain-containing protein [Paenibacillus sp. AGC30]
MLIIVKLVAAAVFIASIVVVIVSLIKKNKEGAMSTTLITAGLGIINGSFGTFSDKFFAALIQQQSETNYVQLAVGCAIFLGGLYSSRYVRNKLYILNINGYRDYRIEDHQNDLGLSPFEFKENTIDFIRLFKRGPTQQNFDDIYEEIKQKIDAFKRESVDVKRAYTGIAPIPFILLAGRHFGGDGINEHFELRKGNNNTYYRLKSNKKWKFFATKYPALHLTMPNLNQTVTEIVLTVGLTSKITASQAEQFSCPIVDLSLDNPMDNAILFKEQLSEYNNQIYKLLIQLSSDYSNLQKIHLLYSGQSCLIFELGKVISDTRMAEIISYQFERQQTPNYPWGITLNGTQTGTLT